jgi:SAM-dependent methyltransferase
MAKEAGELRVPREKERIAKGSGDRVRWFFNQLKRTPFHPQWIAIRNEEKEIKAIARFFQGRVLEIGSGNRRLEKYLSFQIRYISLDYPPSGKRYRQNPHVWGDASHLPFRNNTLDGTALLEVIEHLPTPQIAFQEISRVLKPGGIGVITTPFLYPIHDAPHDFGRLTSYQFFHLAKKAGLEITLMEERGSPLETATLLASLALAKTALRALEKRSLSGVVFLPAMLLVPILNMLGRILSTLLPVNGFMPTGYLAVLRKRFKE